MSRLTMNYREITKRASVKKSKKQRGSSKEQKRIPSFIKTEVASLARDFHENGFDWTQIKKKACDRYCPELVDRGFTKSEAKAAVSAQVTSVRAEIAPHKRSVKAVSGGKVSPR